MWLEEGCLGTGCLLGSGELLAAVVRAVVLVVGVVFGLAYERQLVGWHVV